MSGGKNHLVEAEKLLKAGQKLAKGGWFSKPDYENAAYKYAEAAKSFRLGGNMEKYISSLSLSADAYEKSDSLHTAASNYETCANAAEREKMDKKIIIKYLSLSAPLYLMNNNPNKALANLVKCAKLSAEGGEEEREREKAVQYALEACEIIEREERGKFANDTFKSLISILIRADCIEECVTIVKFQNKIFLKHIATFEGYLYKGLLSLIILLLHLEKYEDAVEEMKTADGTGGFMDSQEGSAAHSLMEAVQNNSEEMLEDVKKLQAFDFIDNQICRLFKKLTLNGDKLQTTIDDARQQENEDDFDFR